LRIEAENMKHAQKGVVYLWTLFAVTVAGIVLAGTGQVWQIKAQREKEQELLFIGDQFRKAIMSYYNNPLTGVRQYPEKLEDLLEDKRGPVTIRHLRKIYIDPMTRDDDWGVIIEEPPQQQATGPQTGTQGAAGLAGLNVGPAASTISVTQGIAGVYSLSMQAPRKKAQFPEHYASFSEAETYQDWRFVFKQQTGTGSTGQQNQQGQQGGSGAVPPTSPFGGAGGARSGGGGGQNIFGGQGGGSSGQPPAAGQNPFAR
jgi:type II secretory pathway pseudopilin PulG